LIAKAKNGDEEAFRTIIISSQRLVVKEALKYYFKGDNLLDLINEGNKGLIEALKKFDLARENRFFTYAMWWVRSEIRRYLSKNQNLISLPDIFYNDYLNFKKVYFKLNKKFKRNPSEKELAEYLQIPEKKVKVLLAVPDEIISLDKGFSDDNSANLSSFLPDNSIEDPLDILIGNSIKDLVRGNIQQLTAKESEIIQMRFGFLGAEPMKLREIAKKLHMSPEGIRRIEMKALAKLKNHLSQQGIYGALN
jgi:RNA polymerase primary sigma factor